MTEREIKVLFAYDDTESEEFAVCAFPSTHKGAEFKKALTKEIAELLGEDEEKKVSNVVKKLELNRHAFAYDYEFYFKTISYYE